MAPLRGGEPPAVGGTTAGKVYAVGTHEELVAKDELYAQLAATQLLTLAGRPVG